MRPGRKVFRETYRSSGGKSLNKSSLGVSLQYLVDGVLALHNLHLARKPVFEQLHHAPTVHAVQDQPVIKRGRDKLQLSSVF